MRWFQGTDFTVVTFQNDRGKVVGITARAQIQLPIGLETCRVCSSRTILYCRLGNGARWQGGAVARFNTRVAQPSYVDIDNHIVNVKRAASLLTILAGITGIAVTVNSIQIVFITFHVIVASHLHFAVTFDAQLGHVKDLIDGFARRGGTTRVVVGAFKNHGAIHGRGVVARTAKVDFSVRGRFVEAVDQVDVFTGFARHTRVGA